MLRGESRCLQRNLLSASICFVEFRVQNVGNCLLQVRHVGGQFHRKRILPSYRNWFRNGSRRRDAERLISEVDLVLDRWNVKSDIRIAIRARNAHFVAQVGLFALEAGENCPPHFELPAICAIAAFASTC